MLEGKEGCSSFSLLNSGRAAYDVGVGIGELGGFYRSSKDSLRPQQKAGQRWNWWLWSGRHVSLVTSHVRARQNPGVRMDL